MKQTLIYVALLLTSPVMAQQGDGTDVPARVNTFKPGKVPVTDERIAALQVPQGFEVETLAKDLKNIRIITVAPNGDIYVSRREQGDVLLLKDSNEDGVLDEAPRVVTHRPNVHGLAIGDGQLYMATATEVFRGPINPDGSLGAVERIIKDLPDGGQHPNRTMAFGPDGMLYISVGSSCNACNETNPEHAALLRSTPDGKSRTIFASGLRNTIGFAWDPKTGELWGMDHGIDFLGDDVQPEELNHIVKGKQYGWPHIWGKGGQNPQSTPPGEITKTQWTQMSEPMTLGYTAHAAPMQMVFYTGSQFPADYRGDAFVTMRGSWNRKPASGYEVVRVRFRNGQPTAFEPFLSGFLVDEGQKHVARPVGLAITRSGALLVGDDANGTLYRVSYSGGTPAAAQPTAIPSQSLERQISAGTGVPLVLERTPETAPIAVQSPAFQDGKPMPKRFSAYHEGVSPQLTWNPVPKAVTYVVIAEDPDASPIKPFVHWVAWNIPGSLTGLPEGLQAHPRLTDPEGVLQGATSRGSIGYYGPKPPVGDPPHPYHFQILALDARLEVRPGATRDEVLKAAKGHVIGKGQLVGTYQQTDPPLK